MCFLAIYQELVKVKYMRPLETLHNNLCFKTLNNFLTKMINDRQSPYEFIKSHPPFLNLESISSVEEPINNLKLEDIHQKKETKENKNVS
jgi:hypothetical protein